MPSHIFTRVGYWKELIASNTASVRAAKADKAASDQLHGQDYMVYAYLQLGQDKNARAVIDEMAQIDELQSRCAGRALSRSRRARRATWWSAATGRAQRSCEVRPTKFAHVMAITHFARALGAARSGNPEAAKADIAKLAELRDKLRDAKDAYWSEQVDIQAQVANAWLLYAEGKHDEALKAMSAAADAEDKTEKSPVTPGPLAPARELYGAMLLERGMAKEALAAFEATLKKEPHRLGATIGAAKAAEKTGDRGKARQRYAEAVALAETADPVRPEIAQARAFVAKHDTSSGSQRGSPARRWRRRGPCPDSRSVRLASDSVECGFQRRPGRPAAALAVTFALSAAAVVGVAPTPRAQDAAVPARSIPSIEQRVDAFMEQLETRRKAQGVVGAAVVVAQGDRIVRAAGLGQRSAEAPEPVTDESVFAVGSVTKQFTAMAVALTVSEGKMAFEDHPRKYVPSFRLQDPEADAKLNMIDLLAHRSGLDRSDVTWLMAPFTQDELFELAHRSTPAAKLRERFLYNNAMYALAGTAAARAQQTTYESLLTERLLKPLGMASSTLTLAALTASPNRAIGYGLAAAGQPGPAKLADLALGARRPAPSTARRATWAPGCASLIRVDVAAARRRSRRRCLRACSSRSNRSAIAARTGLVCSCRPAPACCWPSMAAMCRATRRRSFTCPIERSRSRC